MPCISIAKPAILPAYRVCGLGFFHGSALVSRGASLGFLAGARRAFFVSVFLLYSPMDWIAFAKQYGVGAVALILIIAHALLDARREGVEDKASALLQRRVVALESRPKPQDTRFGQEMDRRVDRLEEALFHRNRYSPPPNEYVGP